MKRFGRAKRRRLLPALLEFVGEPIEQSATGAALDDDHRWRPDLRADAAEGEKHLLVGSAEAAVLRTESGMDLDPRNTEEPLGVRVGILDDRPRVAALAGLDQEHIGEIRSDAADDEVDPLAR